MTKALVKADSLTYFGLLVTEFAQSDYDHFSHDHLYAAPTLSRGADDGCFGSATVGGEKPELRLDREGSTI